MAVSAKKPVGIHVLRGNQQRRVKVVGADGEVKGEVPHYAVVQALVEREGIATSLTPEAQVEEELKAISVCEECRERPLSMTGRALEKRRHKERPWRCKRCAAIERNRAQVADAATREAFRSKMRDARKAVMAAKTPEELKEERARMVEAQRTRRARLTPEEREREAAHRSERMKAFYKKKTPEEMEEHRRRAREAASTPEAKQRSEDAARASWAASTEEQRAKRTSAWWRAGLAKRVELAEARKTDDKEREGT